MASCADGAFEFEDDEGKAVDVENTVGNAGFAAFNFELVDEFIEVLAGVVSGGCFSNEGGDLVGLGWAKGWGVLDSRSVECRGL